MRAVMPLVETKPAPKAYDQLVQGNRQNEFQWLSSQGFLFYKRFISSQDGNRCSFHPSCSEYAIQMIKRRGVLIGGLSAFDRLIRCNSLSPELYPFDSRRRLLLDPVP